MRARRVLICLRVRWSGDVYCRTHRVECFLPRSASCSRSVRRFIGDHVNVKHGPRFARPIGNVKVCGGQGYATSGADRLHRARQPTDGCFLKSGCDSSTSAWSGETSCVSSKPKVRSALNRGTANLVWCHDLVPWKNFDGRRRELLND